MSVVGAVAHAVSAVGEPSPGVLDRWMLPLFGILLVGLVALSSLRWLRVAQREHYIPGRTWRIARLWFSRSRVDLVLGVVGVLAALALTVAPVMLGLRLGPLALVAAVVGSLAPLGLRPRGRTSKLAWTGRLKRLVATLVVVDVALAALLVWAFGLASLALLLIAVPLTVDAALAITAVIEKRLSAPFVEKAQRRLQRIRPTVVAITGSYGKTSTKGYVAHMLSASRAVVASPASFNNRLGLSRAVNDGLVEGTEVFVAEMGTYGPGEIRELCQLFPPDIAVITTIGEAHLERMGSREGILRAKSEITERASTVVLPVDEPELAALAERCRGEGKRVITCSATGLPADVVVDLAAGEVRVTGADGAATTLPVGAGVAHAVNLAVAVGVAVALDVEPDALRGRLDALPRAAHRAEGQDAGTGLLVVDDTYNANPVGALAALEEAAALAQGREGRLVVVTPGIVELGHMQHVRNAAFAEAVARSGAHLVVVGRTNRAALLEGAARAGGSTDVVDLREQAVPRATAVAAPQGVVLYENDLPDHYP